MRRLSDDKDARHILTQPQFGWQYRQHNLFGKRLFHPAAHPNFHRRLLATALADPVIESQDLTRSIHDNG